MRWVAEALIHGPLHLVRWDWFFNTTNVNVTADRKRVDLAVPLTGVEIASVRRQILICLHSSGRDRRSEQERETELRCIWWNWCVTTPETHTYACQCVCVCVRRGECNTITHHVDWALGRSLLRWESAENRFNEQQTARGGRWRRDAGNERNCTQRQTMAGRRGKKTQRRTQHKGRRKTV